MMNKGISFCSSNWGRRLNLLVVLALLLSPMMPMPVQAGKNELRADPRLLHLVADHPNDVFKVIVQRDVNNKDLPDDDPEAVVEKGGGKVKKQLKMIESFSAELAGKEIEKLTRQNKVHWISLDAPMFSSGMFSFSVVDMFNIAGSFSGNDGIDNWSAPWQEIGETDGAGDGVVTVASSSNCASANNCLRFGGFGMLNYEGHGVSRQVDLSDAPSATFSFSYRRASATGTTGSVRVQVSGDGGATWTSLASYALNAADSSQVLQSFDISAYRAANTQIRFIGAGYSNRSIYIDNISVSFQAPTNLLKAPTTEYMLDTFADAKFTGNDGTKTFSTSWIESGAGGTSATFGNIRAYSGTKCWNFTGNCLQITTNVVGDNVYRQANLAAASSATLTLWRNNQMTALSSNESVALEASTNGTTWATLRTWRNINDDLGTANESFDLTPFISATTQIRFRVTARSNDQNIYFDNILLQYSTLQNVYNKAIRADKVWNKPPYLDGQGVTVAVVDSGLANNADFQVYGGGSARVVASADMVSTPPNATDLYGHGTHVGGIIGGNGNQSNGARTGIAPGANLVNVKVANSNGMSYAADLVDGLQWIYDNRATYNIKVVNISMNSTITESYHTSPIDAAVEILWFNGIVVVVSAGNNGSSGSLFAPANDPFVITVGATDDMGTANINDDVMASFSAYGTTEDGFAKPDIVAPGRNILSLLAGTNSSIYISHPENRVDNYIFRMSGTSMSAPMVTGAAALLLQDQPTLNPDQVKYRLMATANKTWAGYSATASGAGYLDAYAAVKGKTTQTANTGTLVSRLLTTGSAPVDQLWGTAQWGSAQWGSAQWGSAQWGSAQWGSAQWGSDYWGR